MKCFHAGIANLDCGQRAVVVADVSGRILRSDMPLCSECAQRYASQAVEGAVRWLGLGLLSGDRPITITLRPLTEREQAGSGPLRAAAYQARRGDDVDVFIKRHRDTFPADSEGFFLLDSVLDEYRLAADTGSPLGKVREAGPRTPGED